MLFNSWEFPLFLVIVLGAYYVLNTRAQNILLLAASYVFYAFWNWKFCGLLLLSTVVDYGLARAMAGAEEGRRRALLIGSLVTNPGILGVFKYFNFFVSSATQLLEGLGFQANPAFLEVVLPVGISFYTFQTLAYTIDVYRGRIEPEHNFIVYGIYVAYFPQLVAGPIERAQRLLPQFRKARRVTGEALASGSVLILIGLLRKVVIADNAAVHVNSAFADPGSIGGLGLLSAVFYFSLQIYGDFAGYSAIARGTSRLFGIELMENFQQPYFATNITAFWRRWHISLSTWLRDYLYIPLGGNRGTKAFAYRNLMITMLLGGLWHGAAWQFIVWGGIHGVALAVHKWWLRGKKALTDERLESLKDLPRRLLGWTATMAVVVLAWVFFRAESFGDAFLILERIFTLAPGKATFTFPLVAMLLLVALIDIPQWYTRNQVIWLSWPWAVRGVVYAASILLLTLLASTVREPFIYFQF